MKVTQTGIKDLLILEPKVFKDNRGYFFESFNKKNFDDLNINSDFIQDNQSFSSYGTIRGIHLQKGEYSQSKLVRVLQGEVLDVAVDLRPGSLTFGHHFSIILNDKLQNQLYVPRGFGHGFSVLSETAIFSYKCDNFYNKESEDGIIFNDSDLNIDWKIPEERALISEKDHQLGSLQQFKLKSL